MFQWRDSISHKEHRQPNLQRDASSILEKELELSKTQVLQIKKLRTDFFSKEKVLEKIIRSERDSMNNLMFNEITDDILINQLAKRVSENEFQMELLRINQAKELKSICTPNQLEKFGGLVKEIRDYFKPENQPKNK